jgi:hypothetical protein
MPRRFLTPPCADVQRRLLVVGVGLAVALFAVPAVAHAAGPVPGGRYVGSVNVRHAAVRVALTLANDGLEFANDSYLSASVSCSPSVGSAEDYLLLSGNDAVNIRRGGRFRYSERVDGRSWVTGRFSARGHAAVGRFALRGSGCRTIRGRFRAPLVGRPNATQPGVPSACDRVSLTYSEKFNADDAYRVFEQATGCTPAREFARRWDASRSCRALPLGGTCAVRGAVCQAIKGGRFSSLASVRCVPSNRPNGVVELVHFQPCAPNPDQRSLWAINLACATAIAFPVQELIGDINDKNPPCGESPDTLSRPTTCRPVAGFTCRARSVLFEPDYGFHARCINDRDPTSALEMDVDYSG